MTLPVTSGSMQFNGVTYDLGDGSALLDVELQYLPDSGAQLDSGQRVRLIVKKTSSDPQKKAVHVTDYSGGLGPDHDLIRALMIATLDTWCNEHLDDFLYVFASVDISTMPRTRSAATSG